MSKKAKERGDAPPCGADGCFSGAVFEVIPRGRWRNMPITKACKAHSRPMADAYTTKTGEKGWADLEMICLPAQPKKPAKPSQKVARIAERVSREEPAPPVAPVPPSTAEGLP